MYYLMSLLSPPAERAFVLGVLVKACFSAANELTNYNSGKACKSEAFGASLVYTMLNPGPPAHCRLLNSVA